MKMDRRMSISEPYEGKPVVAADGSSGLVLEVAELPQAFRRTLGEAIGGLAAAGLLGAVIQRAGLPPGLLGGVGAMVLVYAIRLGLASRAAAAPQATRAGLALQLTIAMALSAGIVGGTGAWSIAAAGTGPWLYLACAAVILATLTAITAQAGAAAAGYAFIVLALAPAAVGGLMSGGVAGLACAAGVVLTGITSFFLVQQFSAMRLQQAQLEVQRADLETTLTHRQAEIEKLATSVRAHEKKERELQGELRKASADLGLVHNKTRLLSETIQRISIEDTATGLANSLHFATALKMEWSRMRRNQQPLTLLRIQLDDFKDYHRNYDSKMLDRCITDIAEVVRDNGRRPGDCAARIGGYDFALLLPGADSASAVRIAERVRMRILELKYPNKDNNLDMVTASIGVATILPDDQTPIPELQRRCDSALHEAEFKGGNVVMRYRSLETIGLENWNPDEDGSLSQQTMAAKLRRRGLKPLKKTAPGARYLVDKRMPVDYAFGVLKGRLKVSREGQTAVLGPGDCWLVKAGAVVSAESTGDMETICVEAAAEPQ